MSVTYISNTLLGDGIGSQYQHIISVLLIAMHENCEFIYNPVQRIQHNYDNDPDYINKFENLMNIRAYYPTVGDPTAPETSKIIFCSMDAKYHIDKHIDDYATDTALTSIRKMFWANKNDSGCAPPANDKTVIRVAAHIRRINETDKELPVLEPERFTTTNEFYIEIMKNLIREHNENYAKAASPPSLEFHVYSQGHPEDFEDFLIIPNLVLHINENVFDTFVDLVSADILITSFSSFSYTAALLNTNTVLYHEFWHKPRANWRRIGKT